MLLSAWVWSRRRARAKAIEAKWREEAEEAEGGEAWWEVREEGEDAPGGHGAAPGPSPEGDEPKDA